MLVEMTEEKKQREFAYFESERGRLIEMHVLLDFGVLDFGTSQIWFCVLLSRGPLVWVGQHGFVPSPPLTLSYSSLFLLPLSPSLSTSSSLSNYNCPFPTFFFFFTFNLTLLSLSFSFLSAFHVA